MAAEEFQLHARLQADTLFVEAWPLCDVLLMNDAQYPWVILVPRRPGLREIHELSPPDQQAFLHESCYLGRRLLHAFAGEKLNVAALGNMVPQLHIHHVVRHPADATWPAPVWGKLPARPYAAGELADVLSKLKKISNELPDLCGGSDSQQAG